MGGTGSGGSSRTTPSRAPSDKAAIDAANKANSNIAKTTPALKSDLSRSVSAKPMGASVGVNFPTGGRISGAIQSVKQTPVADSRSIRIPERTVVPTSPGAGGGFGRVDSAQKSLTRGSLTSPVGPASGVTAPRDSYGALQERLNQRSISESYRSQTGYPSAPQGVYGPRAGVDTRYLGTKDMPGMITTGMTSPYSGAVDQRFSAASTLRAYEAAKRVPGKMQDRVPSGVVPRVSPEERYIMNRPDVAQGAPSLGKTRGLGDLSSDVFAEEGIPGYGIDPNNIQRGFSPGTKTPASLSGSGYYADSPVSTSAFADPNARISPGTVIGNKTGIQGVNYGIVGLDESPVRTKQIYDRILPESPPTPGMSRVTNIFATNPRTISEDLRKQITEGYEGFRPKEDTSFGVPGPETPPNDYVGPINGDVYGPEYVDPEIQELMKKQEKLNKIGIEGMKRVPGFGSLVSASDSLTKLFTGKTIAGHSADLKRAYMQASDEGKAALEDKYPNLTKFAEDAGLTPKRDMSNYTNWAEKSGLRVAPDRRGGGENSGILSLTRQPNGDETTTPRPDEPSTTPGRRPDIYYMWDLGVNIPSPGDPNYTQYQTYLAERLAAQRAMGYV